MAEVVVTRRAERDLQRLDPPIQRRILEKLKELTEDPLRHASKLTDTKIGSFRFRVGDYRAIFDFEDDTVVVLRVGHRREIYS